MNRWKIENDFQDLVNVIFSKKFQLTINPEWTLPEPLTCFTANAWNDGFLQSLKTKLNLMKGKLNDFDIMKWNEHTRKRNPAAAVTWKVKHDFNPEFLTQAWTKFYECASVYNIVPEDVVNEEFVSLHLCEAPGAFITSLNHYLKTHHKDIKWKWRASTLNPYHEDNSSSTMICDDRFMFHTLANWDFGHDHTGNLMDWINSQAIIDNTTQLGKVMLVTADGSIDCMEKPEDQEEVTSPLHYCEIVTALQALSKGGSFIFKLFTVFEHSTVCLLYLVSCVFKDVSIFKPATSKQGNSEVYAVCLDFVGRQYLEPHLVVLRSAYGTNVYSERAMFSLESIPVDFLAQLRRCAEMFCDIQCKVINNNFLTFDLQIKSLYHCLNPYKNFVANTFIEHYNLKSIRREDEILKGILNEDKRVSSNLNPRHHHGSYTNRQLYNKMNSKDKLSVLMHILAGDNIQNSLPVMSDDTYLSVYDHHSKLNLPLNITKGKPVSKINSSKFIFLPLLKLFLKIISVKDFINCIHENDEGIVAENMNNGDYTISFPNYECVTDYDVHEKKYFLELTRVMKKLKVGDNLCLMNFNLLTHFNVSIVTILSRTYFESVGFVKNSKIVFRNLLNKQEESLLDMIAHELSNLECGNAILSVLPISVSNSGDVFDQILLYNNAVYRERCSDYLLHIQKSFDNVNV